VQRQPNRSDLQGVHLRTDDVTSANPLTASAAVLLSIAAKLRTLPFHHDVGQLQKQLVSEVKQFEFAAQQRGVSERDVKIASYLLCTLLDDAALKMPWGSQGQWGQGAVSVQVHRDAEGGEKFFQILSHMMQQPAPHQHLIELAYLCLSLGFEGKHRGHSGAAHTLVALRQEVYRLIRNFTDKTESTLSRQHPDGTGYTPPKRQIPLWVTTAVTGLGLVLIYWSFAVAINRTSETTVKRLTALEGPRVPIEDQAPHSLDQVPVLPKPPRDQFQAFRTLLQPNADRIKVLAPRNGKSVTLRLTQAFVSGSDQITPTFEPILQNIARELTLDQGCIVVTGHTDSIPLPQPHRFSSNQQLSEARAEAVSQRLTAGEPSLTPRIRTIGQGATQPYVANDSKANQALNRRVEIELCPY
jgi:type VI secretion system protein ImpK